ncbi:MAG: carboxypeptidase-like regulatory domain-containing protein, partial [Bacteroidales bacterium]|nr:carboxypeptidase-like regulatory domain-containing protein [Bacteroidales bacterium]
MVFLDIVHYKRITLFLQILVLSVINIQAQKLTKIKGQVIDKSNGEPLPFVNVFFEGKNIGTVTDYDGNYELVTQWASGKLTASFIGYNTQTKVIQIGKSQVVNFELVSENVSLGEIVVTSKKKRYRNKNNPAVDLIKKVIAHKDKNRLESLDYYNYDKHEKIECDLNNITKKFQN